MTKRSFGRILLAVDGSPASQAAEAAAGRLAAATGSEVVVLHAWSLRGKVRDGVGDIDTVYQARQLVEEVADRLRAAGVRARGRLVNASGPEVGPAIERTAEEVGARLVAVGSRGLSDLAGVFEGSVSHQLIADLDCPVLVAPPASPRTDRLERILLAVAHRAESGPLAELAVAVAKPAGAAILAVHVMPPPVVADGYAYLEPEAEAAEIVEATVARLQAEGLEASGKVLRGSDPVAAEVARAARDWDADLVISGSRRHRDLAALVVGATDHELIRRAGRPVLVAGRLSS